MLALAAPASTSCRAPPAGQELQLLGGNQSLALKPGFSVEVDVFRLLSKFLSESTSVAALHHP